MKSQVKCPHDLGKTNRQFLAREPKSGTILATCVILFDLSDRPGGTFTFRAKVRQKSTLMFRKNENELSRYFIDGLEERGLLSAKGNEADSKLALIGERA